MLALGVNGFKEISCGIVKVLGVAGSVCIHNLEYVSQTLIGIKFIGDVIAIGIFLHHEVSVVVI